LAIKVSASPTMGSIVLTFIESVVKGLDRRGRIRAEWIENIKRWRVGLREAHQQAVDRRNAKDQGLC